MQNLIVEYVESLLKIERQEIRKATPEEYASYPKTGEDVKDKQKSNDEITWGDLIDVLNAKINSINKLNKAKLIFKIVGAASIESTAEIGLEAADSYINITNSIAKNCFKIVEPIAVESFSSSILKKVNKKIKSFISSKTKSVEETLACFLLKIYKSKSDNSLLKNLQLDKNISKIIDDKIEIEFLIYLSERIVKDPKVKDRKISLWSINDLLKEYLRENYDNRTITGYYDF